MTVQAIREQFLDFLTTSGVSLELLTPAIGFDKMFQFYREHRVAHCPTDEDGDMLLYQWGVYDWGEGEHFELNLTRQLMTAAGDGDEEIAQLAMTFRYPPDAALRKLGDGEAWCDEPALLERFVAGVQKSKAFQTVSEIMPLAMTLTLEDV